MHRCHVVGVGRQGKPRRSAVAFVHTKHNYPSWCGKVGGPLTGEELSLLFLQMTRHPTPPLFFLPPHTPVPTEQSYTLNMDITGHFESASCVIEVDRSATLAQVKGKLVVELGVPRARHVGVRMRGGGDIGNDDLRICDTEMDEGCAVELYCTGANITPGVIRDSAKTYSLVISPCDRYLAVLHWDHDVDIFDTETRESLGLFPCLLDSIPSFSPCSEWISFVNNDTVEVHNVKTGALKHSFGDEGDERSATAWSPRGTKLLSCCGNKGLQVWDIATGVLVHEWSHIAECKYVMVVTGDRVAMFGNNSKDITIWDYTTGVEVLVLTCPYNVHYVSLSPNTPNQRFIAACTDSCVRVWDFETGESVFEDDSEDHWTAVAVSNDVVATYSSISSCVLQVWSISTGKQLLCLEFDHSDFYGVAISSCSGVMLHGMDKGVEIVDISHVS